MGSKLQRLSTQLEQLIHAPRSRVFRAWAEVRELEAWAWGTIGRDVRAEVDFRVGGALTISTARKAGARWSFSGFYSVIEPERTIAHSLKWDAPMGYDDARETVSVEFRSEGEQTRVVFRHEGEFAEEALAGHREGWINVLETLRAHVEGAPV